MFHIWRLSIKNYYYNSKFRSCQMLKLWNCQSRLRWPEIEFNSQLCITFDLLIIITFVLYCKHILYDVEKFAWITLHYLHYVSHLSFSFELLFNQIMETNSFITVFCVRSYTSLCQMSLLTEIITPNTQLQLNGRRFHINIETFIMNST